MKKRLLATLMPLALCATMVSCGGENGGNTKHDYEFKIWCDTAIKAMTEGQVQAWVESVKESYDVGFKVEELSEASAAGNMTTDVDAGADVYFFAQDQFARLKNAGALTEIVDANIKAKLLEENDDVYKSAASLDGTGANLYAWPVTSDNTYFMYYDKAVFPDQPDGSIHAALDNMTDIIAALKTAEKKIYFNLTGSAWYNASYFMAFGAYSKWTTNENGAFTEYEDNYRDKGLKPMIAMYELLKEKAVLVNSDKASEAFTADSNGIRSAAIAVSGTWDYANAKVALGDNLGVARLPNVTAKGDTQRLSPFTGCKLLGVKPQADGTKAALAQSLAKFLSTEEAQMTRFSERGWGPSNKAAQAKDEVKNNPVMKAIAAQNEGSVVQGQYPGGWWTTAAGLAENLAAMDNPTDDQIRELLINYDGTIDTYVNG